MNFVFVLPAFILNIYMVGKAITYKFISCFNFYNVSFVQARIVLILIYFLGTFVTVVFLSLMDTSKKCVHIGSFFLLILTITLCGLNIALLVNVNRTPKDISPKTIKIALLKWDEIEKIKSGGNLSEVDIDAKILGSLNELIKSENKSTNSKRCSKESCTYYYKRFYQRRPNHQHDYPVYNYRFFKNDGYSLDDEKLFNNYGVYMIQEFLGKKEPAWKGFGKCEVKQPKFDLKLDRNLPMDSATNL
ncbi:hypothetical protein BpHYR1_003106 [Brachionus plicatilis]|uniref:Uncharacterized protein n=1 Tax=Brachionus plicatilis TaxID=10195 RepID=A0A3M7P8Q0_BRAPC|nr:hypothetical protein BpHYR1_003106 [Brachionus plicatilis]